MMPCCSEPSTLPAATHHDSLQTFLQVLQVVISLALADCLALFLHLGSLKAGLLQ
jgi:hypothetical protein